jgi:glutathione synthase/RimK-type ligase-like ATP-grasp enzyme
VTARELALHLMREGAERRGFTFEVLDRAASLCAIGDGRRRVVLRAGSTPLNAHAAVLVAREKSLSAAVLERAGFRVPAGIAVALRGDAETAASAETLRAFVRQRGFPLFVKPDEGSWGRYARRVADQAELHAHLQTIARRHEKAVVQEVLAGDEFRIFVLDGEPLFAYRHEIGRIDGDGAHTFTELLDALAARRPAMNLEYGIDRDLILRQMIEHGCSWRSILPAGVSIRLSDAANLIGGGAAGAIATDVAHVRAWASGVVAALGLRVCGIDLFASDFRDPSTFIVLEVNSNPGLTSLDRGGQRELAYDIWARMLDAAVREAPAQRQTRRDAR